MSTPVIVVEKTAPMNPQWIYKIKNGSLVGSDGKEIYKLMNIPSSTVTACAGITIARTSATAVYYY